MRKIDGKHYYKKNKVKIPRVFKSAFNGYYVQDYALSRKFTQQELKEAFEMQSKESTQGGGESTNV